jgi:LmbE family N-acetylglucosaminyl deacetylase
MISAPTLVCVHAHPDDEALFSAGTTAHYASLGYEVVLVTCTNGQLGLDGAGRAGSHRHHDLDMTRVARAGELAHAATLAGFHRVVTLGYDDSGMRGWSQNDDPHAFMNADVDRASRTLAALFDEVGATVVVTYDEHGFYGHPDHVMANTLTRRALEAASTPQRLYYVVAPASVLGAFVGDPRVRELALPDWLGDAGLGVPDEQVTTSIDVTEQLGAKRAAIEAHASQSDNGDLVTMDKDLFALLFGVEHYQRAWSRRPAVGDDTDLFGGLP